VDDPTLVPQHYPWTSTFSNGIVVTPGHKIHLRSSVVCLFYFVHRLHSPPCESWILPEAHGTFIYNGSFFHPFTSTPRFFFLRRATRRAHPPPENRCRQLVWRETSPCKVSAVTRCPETMHLFQGRDPTFSLALARVVPPFFFSPSVSPRFPFFLVPVSSVLPGFFL